MERVQVNSILFFCDYPVVLIESLADK